MRGYGSAHTMGDAAGAMSVYTGPDVQTSISQAQAASGSAQTSAQQAASYAYAALTTADLPSAQWAADGAQQSASDALHYAAVAVAAANNAGLAMNATAQTIANNWSPVIPDSTTTSGGTVVSTHTGGGH